MKINMPGLEIMRINMSESKIRKINMLDLELLRINMSGAVVIIKISVSLARNNKHYYAGARNNEN